MSKSETEEAKRTRTRSRASLQRATRASSGSRPATALVHTRSRANTGRHAASVDVRNRIEHEQWRLGSGAVTRTGDGRARTVSERCKHWEAAPIERRCTCRCRCRRRHRCRCKRRCRRGRRCRCRCRCSARARARNRWLTRTTTTCTVVVAVAVAVAVALVLTAVTIELARTTHPISAASAHSGVRRLESRCRR